MTCLLKITQKFINKIRDETLKYLKKDLNCLYEILIKANNQIFADYKINIMEAITIPSLDMKTYLSKYYNVNILIINKPGIYRNIKQAYYGGMTENISLLNQWYRLIII